MDLLEKDVIFGGIIYGAGIQFSPPLIFPTIDEYGGEHFVDINSDFLDVEVQIKGDRIYAISDEINSLNDYVDYFNRLIAVFNIIGIPLDFINRSDIIGLIRDVKGKKIVEIVESKKAYSRGKTIPATRVNDKDHSLIILSFLYIWGNMKTKGLLKSGHFYLLLGYSRYYYFHHNWFFSFLNGWMFIEAMIEFFWRKVMMNKFKTKTQSPIDERNWTAQVKIDELYMFKIIDKNLRNDLQKLRGKRNKVFHVDAKSTNRNVEQIDAQKCYITGLKLYYKALDEMGADKIFDSKKLREKINKNIHNFPGKNRKTVFVKLAEA